MNVRQAKRRRRYLALLKEFGIDPKDTGYTAAEDAAELLKSGAALERWAAVTRGNTERGVQFHYVYPTHPTAHSAQAHATGFVNDDIYAEFPVAVVNLDTGERLLARATYKWRNAKIEPYEGHDTAIYTEGAWSASGALYAVIGADEKGAEVLDNGYRSRDEAKAAWPEAL